MWVLYYFVLHGLFEDLVCILFTESQISNALKNLKRSFEIFGIPFSINLVGNSKCFTKGKDLKFHLKGKKPALKVGFEFEIPPNMNS